MPRCKACLHRLSACGGEVNSVEDTATEPLQHADARDCSAATMEAAHQAGGSGVSAVVAPGEAIAGGVSVSKVTVAFITG